MKHANIKEKWKSGSSEQMEELDAKDPLEGLALTIIKAVISTN